MSDKLEKDDVFVIDEDCDEDVPGDFFDDFLKEDFMAGLDIVDDDQWEIGDERKNDNVVLNKENEQKTDTVMEPDKERFKDRRKGDRRDKPPPRRDKGRGIDADEFDIRRDPNKTKRAIQRDKAKCEKDKEKKLITEKLKLVETGLVPPGMETEIDIPVIERNKETEVQRKSSSKNPSPLRRRRSRLRSVSPRRRNISPRRRSRNRSPLRMSPRRSPRRSPLRRKSRELIFRERRSRERSIERTLRSLRRSRSSSPYRDRRLRYSPDHNRRRRRTRSRSRDKKNEKKSFLQEIVEKLREARPSSNIMPPNQYLPHGLPHMQSGPHMQFDPHMQPGLPHMQPIPPHIQPDQNHMPPGSTSLQPLPTPGISINPVIPGTAQPVPAPIFPLINSQSAPMQGPPQNQYDPYDQSFFIGTPQPQGNLASPNEQSPNNQQSVKSKNSRPPASSKNTDIADQEVGQVMNSTFSLKLNLRKFCFVFSYFMIRR